MRDLRISPNGSAEAEAGARTAERLSRRAASDVRAARIAQTRDPLRRRLLAVADTLAALATSASFVLFDGELQTAIWASLLVPVWILLAKLHGLYDRDHRALRHLTVDEVPRIVAWSVSATAVTLLSPATSASSATLSAALRTCIVAAGSMLLLRSAARALWRKITPPERTLVVGNGPLAAATCRKLEIFPDIHAELVGEPRDLTLDELRAESTPLAGVDRVILAPRTLDEDLLAELLESCRHDRIKLTVVPPARAMFGTAAQLEHVADLSVLGYNTSDASRSTMMLKRALDVVGAAFALVFVAPLLVVAAICVKLDSPGSALFAQVRAGVRGRPFRMYKFRTMAADAEQRLGEVVSLDELREPMFKFRSDPRVTRLGRFLRRTSIDELPQLVNVLKGEMSLVGPRPEQVEVVGRYRSEHNFRLDVKPGITGPMQVYGRGELTFEERLSVEREYIENLSIGRDLRILALTVAAVASGKGAF